MRTSGISRARQLRFLAALARSGNVASAAIDAHVDRTSLAFTRRTDQEFAQEWEAAEQAAVHKLEQEAWRRAVFGVPEPLISEGKVVRDDEGRPLSIQRYSDTLLIEMLRMNRYRVFGTKKILHTLFTASETRQFILLILIALMIALLYHNSH